MNKSIDIHMFRDYQMCADLSKDQLACMDMLIKAVCGLADRK